MPSLALQQSVSAPWLPSLASLRNAEPRLFGLALLLVAALAPTLAAHLVDERTVLGVDVWLKPIKFQVALAVYLLTLAFFARFIPDATKDRRWYRIYVGAVMAAIVMEMLWIGGAAMLGTASHFNIAGPGAFLYPAMGAMAVLLTSITAVYAWLIARNPETGLSPVLKESVVLGLAMVLPLTLVTAGTMSQMGSHLVGGAAGDAGGLALMGWARQAGDLRVAHFFATHALHAVPLFGLLSVALFGPSYRMPVRLFAAAYAVLVAATFAQALSGEPFLVMLSPD